MIRLILFLALSFPVFAQFTFRDVGLGGLLHRAATAPAGPSYLSGAELTGLTGYWRMDAASGADEPEAFGPTPAYNLFASNIVANVGSVSGVITNARLTSASGKAFFANNNGVFDAVGHDWTWMMWIKMTNSSSSQFINVKYDGGFQNSQYMLYWTGADLTFNTFGEHEEIDGCCNPFTVYTETINTTTTNIVVDTWYFIAFGIDGSDSFISVNGGAKEVVALTDPIHTGTAPRLTIGAYLNGGANNFKGAIDEMIFYSTTAKDIAEIQSIYNSGAGKTLSP